MKTVNTLVVVAFLSFILMLITMSMTNAHTLTGVQSLMITIPFWCSAGSTLAALGINYLNIKKK